MTELTRIQSVEDFVTKVRDESKGWPHVWFRGEPAIDTALLPKLYRARGKRHDENKLLQTFRMKAPALAVGSCPERSAIDQWLFLAQHVGLPTRLLDWSESALVGIYFAFLVEEKPSIVWMLNPIELNRLSVPDTARDQFPLTWIRGEKGRNAGFINIRGAWQNDSEGTETPIAIMPTHTHPRMSAQRSCFTIHGKVKSSLVDQVPPHLLKGYEIEPRERVAMQNHLYLLGIGHSTVWPDLDGLAEELRELY